MLDQRHGRDTAPKRLTSEDEMTKTTRVPLRLAHAHLGRTDLTDLVPKRQIETQGFRLPDDSAARLLLEEALEEIFDLSLIRIQSEVERHGCDSVKEGTTVATPPRSGAQSA